MVSTAEEADEPGVPLLIQMASHPLRWALLSALAVGDHRVRELAALVDKPQNLVSYHLRLLRSAGLVGARRSSFDGRDSYYCLELARCADAFGDAATALHPALAPATNTANASGGAVLFLCTGNGARSPMAEALLHHRSGGCVRVASAGSHPKPQLHPHAVRVMREEYGIDLGDRRPQPISAVAGRTFDYVITLCDKVREVPADHGSAVAIHWSVVDPSATADSDQATYPKFRCAAKELDARIHYWLPVLACRGGQG